LNLRATALDICASTNALRAIVSTSLDYRKASRWTKRTSAFSKCVPL